MLRIRSMLIVAALAALLGCSVRPMPTSIHLPAQAREGVVFGHIAPLPSLKEGWAEIGRAAGGKKKVVLDPSGIFVLKTAAGPWRLTRFGYQDQGGVNTIELQRPYEFEVVAGKVVYIGKIFVSPLRQDVYLSDDFVRDGGWFFQRFGEGLPPISKFANDKYYALMKQYAPAALPVPRVENGRAYVAAANFLMGDVSPGNMVTGPGGLDLSQIPPHEAAVSSFWIDQYPAVGKTADPNERKPAVMVTWAEAAAVCQSRAGRLPTEAESELAARGPRWGDPYYAGAPALGRESGSDQIPAIGGAGWHPSPYGAYYHAADLAEWTSDYYHPDAYRQSPVQDPTGPATGTLRVVRAGSYRFAADPETRLPGLGFRCVYSETAAARSTGWTLTAWAQSGNFTTVRLDHREDGYIAGDAVQLVSGASK